jgi:hypothetical protein
MERRGKRRYASTVPPPNTGVGSCSQNGVLHNGGVDCNRPCRVPQGKHVVAALKKPGCSTMGELIASVHVEYRKGKTWSQCSQNGVLHNGGVNCKRPCRVPQGKNMVAMFPKRGTPQWGRRNTWYKQQCSTTMSAKAGLPMMERQSVENPCYL